MIIEAKNGFVVLIAEEGKIFKSKVSGDILTNKLIPLRLGYVGVINRGQRDIDTHKNMELQWRDEEAFLRANYGSIAHLHGTRFLREKLNVLLLKHIKKNLPSIVTKVEEFKAEKMYNE